MSVVAIGGPLTKVHGVRPPLQDAAAMKSVPFVPAPPAGDIERVVRPPRARAQPTVPIEDLFGRFRLRGQPVLAGDGWPHRISSHVGVDGLELAEFAGASGFDGPDEIRAVAPLCTGLVDPAGAAERIGQRAALLNRHRAGLLAVDVLSRVGCLDGEGRMPDRKSTRLNSSHANI